MVCCHCEREPCCLVLHRQMIDDTTVSFDSDTPANTARHSLYRAYTAAEHGYLGKGHRITIPACVLAYIRSLYPDGGGKYTGHRDANFGKRLNLILLLFVLT